MSQFRKNLTSQMGSQLATGGENALSNIRQRALASGFGFNQPITAGAESGLQSELARQRSEIPLRVEQQAAPLELAAAGQYQPQGYFNQAMQAAREEEARKGGLWGGLANLGLGIASSFIPGGNVIGGLLKRKPKGDMSMGAGY